MSGDHLMLFDHNQSVCCKKVRLLLAEKNVNYERQYIALEKGENHKEWFTNINPLGLVPVLVHNDRVITESAVICEYINESFNDGPDLIPNDPYQRARLRLWVKKIDEEMHKPHIGAISFTIAYRHIFLEHFDTPEKRDAHYAKVKNAVSREMQRTAIEHGYNSKQFVRSILAYDKFLQEMERTLNREHWLAGDEISIADFVVVPYIARLEDLKLAGMWETKPAISNWLSKIKRRTSWQAAILDFVIDDPILNLMNKKGKEAWPKVQQILSTA